MMKEQEERHPNLNAGSFVPPLASEMTLDEFTSGYKAPANEDSFFDFHNPPTDWALVADLFSRPHLFKHAVALAKAETSQYIRDKAKVERLSEDETISESIQDAITTWLSYRPRFALTRAVRVKRRYQWNTWDKPTHRELISLSGDLGVSATLLFIIYSAKSMATRQPVSPHIKKLLKKVVEEWDRWHEQETQDFSDFLRSFTHKGTRKECRERI